MRLLRSRQGQDSLTRETWNEIAERLRRNKGDLGDLGGGNHFLDALISYDDGQLYFLIHTGSRSESGHVDDFVESPERFDAEFDRVVAWAAENRAAVQKSIEATLGKLDLVLDLPHNNYEILASGGVIIRKGSVRATPGSLNIIPSHMSGDVSLVEATDRVGEALFSLSHGTGRAMSRSECKVLAEGFDFSSLRQEILIPDAVQDASLRTDGPFAYRNLDECLELLDGYVQERARFRVVAYMGHL